MNKKIIALILALVVVFALCACSSDKGEPDAKNDDPVATPTPTPVDLPTELPESEDAGEEYIDRITFLGDSTTYGLGYYEMVSKSQVWTDSAGTLALFNQSTANIVYPANGEEILIVDAVKRAQPDILVITLGVNGVSMMDEEYFKSEYTSLIQSIQTASPDTKIICNSIYPVETSYEAKVPSINNVKIDAANGWIKQVAEATGTHFCNTASVLKAADGSMDPANGNGDGLHLCPTGFEKVLNYLRTHAYV